jgi:hypothetical protein
MMHINAMNNMINILLLELQESWGKSKANTESIQKIMDTIHHDTQELISWVQETVLSPDHQLTERAGSG